MTFVGEACARLDLLGGIGDYSGTLALELPLRERVRVELFARRDGEVVLHSASGGEARSSEVRVPLTQLIAANETDRWANYITGAMVLMQRDHAVTWAHGFDVKITSSIPEGAGVSSSAALEIAALRAFSAAAGSTLNPDVLARLGQRIENEIVGAPCGLMDQLTAVFGEAGRLLFLQCQPGEVLGMIAIPRDLSVVGIHSGVRHRVAGRAYSDARVAGFMGYRIAAALRDCPAKLVGGRAVVDDPEWRGYLANCPPERWVASFDRRLPELLVGSEFLTRYGGTTDIATRVDSDRTYRVRAAARHPVLENARVKRFAALIDEPITDDVGGELGDLLFASHASYSACGLGSEATDQIVERTREERDRRGEVFGAKVTGGGSGGTVAILGRPGATERFATTLASELQAKSGLEHRIFVP